MTMTMTMILTSTWRGQILYGFSQNWRQVVILIIIKFNRSSRNMSMSMSMTTILTSTSWWSRWKGQILNSFSQDWWQVVLLTSIKFYRSSLRHRDTGRKSKRIISRNDLWRRGRNI